MRWQPILTGLSVLLLIWLVAAGIESLYWSGTWFWPAFVFGLAVGMFVGFAVCLSVLMVRESDDL